MTSRSSKPCLTGAKSRTRAKAPAPGICAPMPPTRVSQPGRSLKSAATSLTSRGAGKKPVNSNASRASAPGAGLSRSRTAGSTAFASCWSAMKSSTAPMWPLTTWPQPSSPLEKYLSRSILFTDKFLAVTVRIMISYAESSIDAETEFGGVKSFGAETFRCCKGRVFEKPLEWIRNRKVTGAGISSAPVGAQGTFQGGKVTGVDLCDRNQNPARS